MANITPWLSFQSAIDAGPGVEGIGAPWSAPTGALSFGGFETSSGPLSIVSAEGNQTTLLRIAQPNITGSLPLEFRLLGVEVEVRGRWEGASDGTRTVNVQAVVGASVRKSLGACSLPISASPSVCIKGSPTDTMNFTEDNLANPGFGFQLSGSSTTFNTQGNTLFIDSLRVRVFWADLQPPERSRRRTRLALTRGVLA